MENIGRNLIIGGLVLVLVGGALYLGSKLGLPFGRLPGDIRIEGEGGGLYIPIASCILASILITLALNILLRVFRK